MKDNSKSVNLNVLNVALMFVGAIMGAGFASGREIWQFFGVLQGCDVNLWYFDFRKMGEIDSISFEIRVFLMKKARNRVVLASKTSDFSRQNIRTFRAKHRNFTPKKSDVFIFRKDSLCSFSGKTL